MLIEPDHISLDLVGLGVCTGVSATFGGNCVFTTSCFFSGLVVSFAGDFSSGVSWAETRSGSVWRSAMSESGGGLGRVIFFFFFSLDKFERKVVGDKLGSWELMLLSISSSVFRFFFFLSLKSNAQKSLNCNSNRQVILNWKTINAIIF